jgi:hypothetical protein
MTWRVKVEQEFSLIVHALCDTLKMWQFVF